MAPLWAHANAATPITKNKRAEPAAKDVPIALRNQRDIFKMSSRQAIPYIILNPEAGEKLYGTSRRHSIKDQYHAQTFRGKIEQRRSGDAPE
jgi:hypothetical protein